MAGKAKTKSTNNNKNIIIGICSAIVIIAVIAVAIFFATRGPQLNDSYFVSDNTKYVVTTEGDIIDPDKNIASTKIHYVYKYSGDKITDVTMYIEFANESDAKTALEAAKSEIQEIAKDVSTNGKYIVIEIADNQYSGMTLTEVKSIEDANNTNVDTENK